MDVVVQWRMLGITVINPFNTLIINQYMISKNSQNAMDMVLQIEYAMLYIVWITK